MNEQRYYWAWDENSRAIVGPELDENAINQVAYSTVDADFRVFLLPTRDRRKAVSMIKRRLLGETKSLEQSMRRFRHIRQSTGEE